MASREATPEVPYDWRTLVDWESATTGTAGSLRKVPLQKPIHADCPILALLTEPHGPLRAALEQLGPTSAAQTDNLVEVESGPGRSVAAVILIQPLPVVPAPIL